MSSNLSASAQVQKVGLKEKTQEFGRFLSGMVMPNIGAFIAWGLITALFIPVGWLPNEKLATLVGPIIHYLLPLLIAYTGGRAVGGQRGAVVGAVAAMGAIVAADIHMFLGAMIVGPAAGYAIKKVDQALEGKAPAGFEMLINNFSAGITAMIMAMLSLVAIGPAVTALTNAFGAGVKAIVEAGLLPLASVIIEPAKILFLNNAINFGVLAPLGVQQADEIGRSIYFMLESNPGPGLGVLLAYALFAKGMVKSSAPGAIIIHFLGGIHEIYFPYILMKPTLLLAVIGGGMSGVFTFNLLGAGVVATPNPGSIFAYLLMTPKGSYFANLSGVVVAAAVSFLIASVIIKRSKEFSTDSLAQAQATVKDMKAASKGTLVKTSVKKIIVACDAGMGSSAMGASMLKNKVKKAGLDIAVANTAIEEIPSDTDIVITHSSLTPRAKRSAPNAEHISLENFIDTPVYDELVARLSGK